LTIKFFHILDQNRQQEDNLTKYITQEVQKELKREEQNSGILDLRKTKDSDLSYQLFFLLVQRGISASQCRTSVETIIEPDLLSGKIRGDRLYNARYLYGRLQRPWPDLSKLAFDSQDIQAIQDAEHLLKKRNVLNADF
jgi:hypothetical protein